MKLSTLSEIQKYFTFKFLITCFLITFFAPVQIANANDVRNEWKDLWTRCRIAVENSQSVDTHGLLQIAHPGKLSKGAMHKAWSGVGMRFAIVEREWPSSRHGVFRSCIVRLAANAKTLSVTEEALLLREFLIERTRLFSEGTHEKRHVDTVYPLVLLGFGLIGNNPEGCRVISTIAIDSTGNFFHSLTGAQAIRVNAGCKGRSFITPK